MAQVECMRRVKRRSACSALLVQNVIQDITQTCILKVVVFTNWQRLGVWKLLSSVCHSFERQDFLSAMFDVVVVTRSSVDMESAGSAIIFLLVLQCLVLSLPVNLARGA